MRTQFLYPSNKISLHLVDTIWLIYIQQLLFWNIIIIIFIQLQTIWILLLMLFLLLLYETHINVKIWNMNSILWFDTSQGALTYYSEHNFKLTKRLLVFLLYTLLYVVLIAWRIGRYYIQAAVGLYYTLSYHIRHNMMWHTNRAVTYWGEFYCFRPFQFLYEYLTWQTCRIKWNLFDYFI